MKIKKIHKKRFNQKTKKNNKGLLKYNHEIIGILTLTLGVLIFFGTYFKGSIGLFGDFARNFLFGMMGLPSFLIPPIVIIYAVAMIFKKNDHIFNLRALYSLIFLLLASSLIHAGYHDAKNYENMPVLDCIVQFYKDSLTLEGGGILGGIISMPFLLTFQKLGTIIILITLSLINIILLTNISIANFASKVKIFVVRKVAAIKNRKSSVKVQKGADIKDKFEDRIIFEPKTIDDESNFDMDLKTNAKVIDFNLKNASAKLKGEKNINAPTENNSGNATDNIPNAEPIKFIMKDADNSSHPSDNKSKKASDIVEDKVIIAHDGQHLEYKFPPLNLLKENPAENVSVKDMKSVALEGARKLEETLNSFGVEAKVVNISRGPAVTRYELQPSPGVKVSKIVNLADDISLNLASTGVRIEAPIPGKAAIGIEVPNKEIIPVFLKEVIEASDFAEYPSKLAFAVGKDISGKSIVADIAKMPHLLIAGATGSGKSVCINSLLISLLYKASPDEVKLLLIDPKVVELGIYNGIPHLMIPVVTDPRKAAGALNWAVQEMINRYKLFAEKGVRDLKGYNALLKEKEEQGVLPQIVIVIDELADLMMAAPNDVEDAICRLAQMARAAGMHLVIATQRPSVDVITGVIKANIPSRISFAVSSHIDSRTILDMAGAEKLQGKGDMLFYPVGEPKPIRLKGAFVSDKEVERVIEYIKAQANAQYDEDILEELENENEPAANNAGDNDELLPQAIELVVDMGQASVSMIQRRFRVGYARAGRIIDQMEQRGIVGGPEGSKPREVLITKLQWQEMQMADGQ